MVLNNKTYDVLKSLALIWIPAIASLYFGIAGIWNLPYAEEIVGTLTCIDTFIGAICGISASNYNKQNL